MKWGAEVAEVVHEEAENVADAVKDLMDATSGDANEAFGDPREKVIEARGLLQDKVATVVGYLGDASDKAEQQAQQLANQVKGAVGDAVEDAEAAAEKAEELALGVDEAVDSRLDDVQGKINDRFDRFQEATPFGNLDRVQGKVDAASERADALRTKAQQGVAKKVRNVRERLSGVVGGTSASD